MSGRVFGREAELSLLEGFLDSIADGYAVFAIEGKAGIGKTTVWTHGIRHAEARGYRVLACRPSESEARLSFVGLIDLLTSVPDETLAALPEPQRRVLEIALLRARVDRLRPDRGTISVAVLSLLRTLAAAERVVVAVDDAQWLDAPSAAVLEFAARRLEQEPLRMLTSIRLSDKPTATFEHAAGERRQAVRIGPLSIGALHEIIKEQLGRSVARPTLAKIARAAAGNPFYALEIARALGGNGEPRAGEPLPVPDDLGKLVRARIRRLPADSRDALLAASALSAPTLTLIDAAALAAAEHAEIVRITSDDRVEFTHPLFASAVYSSASGTVRRDLHRRLGELVDDIEERARHLALAAEHPDEQITGVLELGALSARSRGAWESAGELLERARTLTPADRRDVAQHRGVQAAEQYVHAGDRARARVLLEEILSEDLPRRVRCDALRLLGEISIHDENFGEAERVFSAALACADGPGMAATIECALSYVRSNLMDFAGGAVHAYRAAELADAAGEAGVVAEALAYCAMFDYLCGLGVDWGIVERSLALEDSERVVPLQWRPSAIAALLLLYVGRLSEAREQLLAVRAMALEQGDESDLAFFLLWLSWLETLNGNFAEAATLADEAAVVASLTGSQSMYVWTLTQRAFVHAHRGEIEQARRDCAEAARLGKFGHVLPLQWIAASLGLLELALGNAQAAWDACEAVTAALETQGIAEPVPAFSLPTALEALVEIGQLERAEALLSALEARARELDRAWALATAARCRGLLNAARGDLAGAEKALLCALREHERLEMPFERARTLLCLGRVQRRRKQRNAARETLSVALEIFDRLGAPLWADRARSELDRTHLREAPGELTPSEGQVVRLAARGLKNREIAERLFVSPKTVEANLARAYRKLGIRSRAELGAAVARETVSRS